MPNNWQTVPLRQVCERVRQKNAAGVDRVLSVVAGRGLVEQEKYFNRRVAAKNLSGYTVVEPGDLVYNKSYSATAPFGVVALNRGNQAGVVSPLYIVFRPSGSLVDGHFVELAATSATTLQSLAGLVKEGGRAHGGINISLDDFFSVLLPLPSIDEQRRIVDLVKSVDSYIDRLQTQAEATRMVRSAVLSDCLRRSGEDWISLSIEESCDILDRFRRPISSIERAKRLGDVPYYGAAGQAGWIDEAIFDEPLVLLGEDAVDFASRSAKKAYRIDGPSWVNNHAHVLRPGRAFINSLMLELLLNEVDYSQYAVFGTRSKLTQASMRTIRLSVPPLAEQRKVVELIGSIDEQIESLQLQVSKARGFRDAALSELLSGERLLDESYNVAVSL